MERKERRKERFESHFGMIMAMAGSAVGLGNLWRFPFLAAQNGGGAFIFVYLILLLTICLPVLMTEITLGRKCRSNVTRVYDNLGAPRWRWAGFITLLTPIVIMAFYTVVGGWSVKYLVQACTFSFTDPGADYSGTFGGFISSTYEPLVYTVIFLAATAIANFGGVKNGIERFSKPMMTVLSVTIILVAIRSLTLPGATEGTKYLLIPDFGKIDGKVLITALGQAFMSLSIGIGILLTYGSYVKTKEDIVMTAVSTGLIDTLFAIIAGLAIIPAVYAIAYMNGTVPAVNAGPGLVFITLPGVFASMPGGSIIAILFFLSLLLAAVTSAISMLEVIVAYFIEEWHLSRNRAVSVSMIIIILLGCICSLSQGTLSGITLAGMNIFDFFDVVSSDVLITVGSLIMVLFAGWRIKKAGFMDELTGHGTSQIPAWMFRYVYFMVRWVAPVIIIVIMLSNILL
ncbi:MAG: sodium-dependent transporter [Bacteroidaceae bacterium]|nr:sodium-dependent transporter [Bacteroidaceae bacterium]